MENFKSLLKKYNMAHLWVEIVELDLDVANLKTDTPEDCSFEDGPLGPIYSTNEMIDTDGIDKDLGLT